ncbi:hypothetical protein P0Y67_11815 [Photobacterium sp. SP02]|uniref:hypothetical protein n=1 Tax=unclassified Photobacterium TaxID=2628852 RepID=UPI001C48C173|nr:hypothetical protein [Photobacterium sp. WH24]MBV7263254.1 hypothetical protein [Photobacterium sp. WH24]
MSKPPEKIDGAKVLEWAWSGDQPFGVICFESGEVAYEIFGIAICKYSDSDVIYRFSCGSNWETEQDSDYQSVDEAKEKIPEQYQNVKARWQKHE